MLACPESPTWLGLKGRRREATEVAEKLWGEGGGGGAAGHGYEQEGGLSPCPCNAVWCWSGPHAASLLCPPSPHPHPALPHPTPQPRRARAAAAASRRGARCWPAGRGAPASRSSYSNSFRASTPSSTSLLRCVVCAVGRVCVGPMGKQALWVAGGRRSPGPSPAPRGAPNAACCLLRPRPAVRQSSAARASSLARWHRRRWAPPMCWAPWWRQG